MLLRTDKQSLRQTRTTCPYCGVGCGVVVETGSHGPVIIKGDHDHPANYGKLCSKGSALGETLGLEGRLIHPEIHGERADWDTALDLVAEKLSEAIEQHGPDSVAFYVSGQLLTEDYYVANKLMKGFVGSANIDTNSRLCMASSVAGHRRAFGADTVPGTYSDLEAADLVVLTGSNLAWCHPVLYQRLRHARSERPDLKVVLIDPRRTMTAEIADLHLAINPDSDVALFAGLLQFLAGKQVVDEDYVRSYTNGFDETLAAASEYSLDRVCSETGVAVADIQRFFDWFAATDKTVTVYSQGVNQSVCGTDKVNAILNCHLATGRIGKLGAGPFSVTGQPNAMGGREVGGLANMLAAHMDLDNAQHRSIVQEFWQSPKVADRAGLKAVDMFQAVADGRIKVLWIMATNPVDSMPEADLVREAISECPFVVVSDVVAKTDTTVLADVKLPSTAWGEKDGTVTNSERRISRQRSFLSAPGETRPDWWQLTQVAHRMGFADAFDYPDVSAIFREHAALSAAGNDGARDFDIGALQTISKSDYEDLDPCQWPVRDRSDDTPKRFFANGSYFTPDGKARFVVLDEAQATTELAAGEFILNTGRVRDHWHTMTRTAKSERLSAHVAEPYGEIHPDDAEAIGVGDADIVEVENGLGRILVRALLTDRQRKGCLFVPIHWTDQHAAQGRVDRLVPAVTDRFSGQPASKNVAVAARRFPAHQFGFAVSVNRPEPGDSDYWAVAQCYGGWRIELAWQKPLKDVAEFAQRLFAVHGGAELDCPAYQDAQKGDHRVAVYDRGRFAGALYLSPQPVAVSRAWAVEQMVNRPEHLKSRHHMIAGRPGVDQPDPGPIVCACNGVGANVIARSVREGSASVDEVGSATGAGTDCGSCRAEISALIDEYRSVQA